MFYRLYILQIDMVDVDFFDTFYYQEQCKIRGNVKSSVLESINNDANENKIKDESSTKILIAESDTEVDSGIDCPDELDLEVSCSSLW